MNLNLNLDFAKSMNLNLGFSRSMNFNLENLKKLKDPTLIAIPFTAS